MERSARTTPSEVPQGLIRVNVQPRAEAEADEAAAWYEAQQPGLGIEFLLELDAAIEKAAEVPLAYSMILREVRRVLVRRFPYAVYFHFRARAHRNIRRSASATRSLAVAIEGASLGHNKQSQRTAIRRRMRGADRVPRRGVRVVSPGSVGLVLS